MRITLDALWWDDGPASTRHVMREIVTHWSDLYPEDDICLLLPASVRAGRSGPPPPSARSIYTRVRPHALAVVLAGLRSLVTFRPQATLTQNFALPTRRSRSYVYLHDLIFLDHPEWFTRPERVYFALMPLLLGRASTVFTSSASEGERITRFFPRAVVAPVGLGVSRELVETAPDAGIARKLGLTPGDFFLTVGRLNIRKNLKVVLEGAAQQGASTADFPMVVVGAAEGVQQELPAELGDALAGRRIIFGGFVSEGELNWLYANARVLVFMSLDEGFGMPPIEAAHHGVPSIVSDIGVFRENLQETAHYLAPGDAAGLASLLTDYRSGRVPADGGSISSDRLKRLAAAHSWEASVHRMRQAIVDDLARTR